MCYKYDPTKTECWFNLDAANTMFETVFNPDTGEIIFEKLDGLLNNFNDIIITTLRCNMDIVFIGSGANAKAILFYITDYITKTQLPTHITYTILEHAVCKFEIINETNHGSRSNTKRLLCKCANALIAKQELSAQQVSSHLLGHEGKYTNHKFYNLYWPSFETYLNNFKEEEDDLISEIDNAPKDCLNMEYGDIIALATDTNGHLAPCNTQVADYI